MLKHNIRSTITSSDILKHNINTSVVNTNIQKHNLRSSVINTNILKHNTIEKIINTTQLKHNLRSVIVKANILKHNLRARIVNNNIIKQSKTGYTCIGFVMSDEPFVANENDYNKIQHRVAKTLFPRINLTLRVIKDTDKTKENAAEIYFNSK